MIRTWLVLNSDNIIVVKEKTKLDNEHHGVDSLDRLDELRIINWRYLIAAFSSFAFAVLVASLVQDINIYSDQPPNLSRKIWILDVDAEQSIFTWLSVNILFVASCVLVLLARETVARKGRFIFHWHFLFFLFLLLSMEEMIGIHEKVSGYLSSRLSHMHGFLYFSWAVPALALSIAGFCLFLPFIRSFPPRIAIQLVISAVIYVGGAAGMEMIGGSVAEKDGMNSLLYHLLADLEEGMEVLGTILFIHAILVFRDEQFLAH